MNIGIDLSSFLKNEFLINDILNKYSSNKKHLKKVLIKYLLNNINYSALKDFNVLNHNSINLFIFTPFENSYIKIIIEELLKEKEINFFEIICCEKKYRNELIKNRNIFYMISKNASFLDEVNSYVKQCLFLGIHDNYLSFSSNTNVFNYIFENQKRMERQIKDPITVLSNVPSIDKIWTRNFSINQATVDIKRNMNVCDYIYSNVCNNLDAKALNFILEGTSKTFTFKEIYEAIDKMAAELKNNFENVSNEVIAVCSPNTPEAIISVLAINKVGATCLLLHPLLLKNDIKDSLIETKAKMIITTDVTKNTISEIVDDTYVEKIFVSSVARSSKLPIKVLYNLKNLTSNPKLFKKGPKEASINKLIIKSAKNNNTESNYIPNKIAFLLKTGGTTNKSKLVSITNENIIANIEQLKYTIPSYKPFDVIEGITPLFHGFGLVDVILTGWSANLTIDLHPRYSEKSFAASIKKNKPSLILGVPTLYKKMLYNKYIKKGYYPYLEVMISGGSILEKGLKNDINNWRYEHGMTNPIFNGYGLTQSTSAIGFTGLNATHEDSVGFPLPYNNVKVVSLTDGHELGYNEVGELCVSGPTIMKGYYHNKKETEKNLKEENGKLWLHTEDICTILENGEICFVDRNNALIIVSGVNIYRSEVEKVVNELDEVDECAVVAIPHEFKMNVPKAYVVLKNKLILTDELKEKFKQYCNSKLDVYHKIYDFEQIEKLPLTNLTKVDYKILEAREQNMAKTLRR